MVKRIEESTDPHAESGGEDLNDLAHEGEALGQVDGGDAAAPGTALVPTPAPPTNAQLFAGAIAAGREAFCAFTRFESPRKTLSDEAVQRLGEVWGPVLDKHGINLHSYLG